MPNPLSDLKLNPTTNLEICATQQQQQQIFMAGAFSDGWVIDRTLFDHAALGTCECCGGGVAMMAQSPLLLELCTDLGTLFVF